MHPRCPHCGNQNGASEAYWNGRPTWSCLECGKFWPRVLGQRVGQTLGQGGTVPGAASGAGGTVDAGTPVTPNDPYGIGQALGTQGSQALTQAQKDAQQLLTNAAIAGQQQLNTQGTNVQGAASQASGSVAASASTLGTVFLLGVGALALVLIFTKR